METTAMIIVPIGALVMLYYAWVSYKIKIERIYRDYFNAINDYNDYHGLKQGDKDYVDPEEALKEFKKGL